ncbi:XkdX family protein [Planococcus faecalis]|uniref:XkdX family protein n=1 Tax=Planococcus faecalis TaxID=1598147 RepID=A0ABN4XJ63_9BACL|nr:XkdX family protein [Planococcus faecalis]AQU79706.1 hypothetical protein AJGP001_10720 [Planococcus faecalis]
MYNSIKRYYDSNRYDNDDVKIFVKAKWITAEQYQEITGIPYQA